MDRIEAIRKSGGRLNDFAIAEMHDYLRRIGYQASDLNKLNVVHITGTKGKGSTSAFTERILRTHLPGRIGESERSHGFRGEIEFVGDKAVMGRGIRGCMMWRGRGPGRAPELTRKGCTPRRIFAPSERGSGSTASPCQRQILRGSFSKSGSD
jgi:hypothetical protein